MLTWLIPLLADRARGPTRRCSTWVLAGGPSEPTDPPVVDLGPRWRPSTGTDPPVLDLGPRRRTMRADRPAGARPGSSLADRARGPTRRSSTWVLAGGPSEPTDPSSSSDSGRTGPA